MFQQLATATYASTAPFPEPLGPRPLTPTSRPLREPWYREEACRERIRRKPEKSILHDPPPSGLPKRQPRCGAFLAREWSNPRLPGRGRNNAREFDQARRYRG